MKFKNIYFVIFITLFFACESNKEPHLDADNLLLGNWVSPVYDEEKTTFIRGNSLPDEDYGITFKQNGELIERTSGFCGTPPLTFFNVYGSFTIDEDLISIATQGFPNFYGWRIVELTEQKLVVKRELSEQEKEHRALMTLFEEISNLAYSTPCSDSNDWSFVAFGAKACGGPQGYLPYNSNIDVTDFLEKVATYTNAEKEFNIKWSIVSDCAVVNPPKSIDCQNEYPVLIY
ncbi:hypothetical protein [Polaribacter sp.]|uniref:hypothetical protein n=1 Tax=Polaribacter sp. TaxID=1920175 RepID=UPI003F6BF8FB